MHVVQSHIVFTVYCFFAIYIRVRDNYHHLFIEQKQAIQTKSSSDIEQFPDENRKLHNSRLL